MLRESTRAGVPVLSLSVSKPRSTRFSVRPTEGGLAGALSPRPETYGRPRSDRT